MRSDKSKTRVKRIEIGSSDVLTLRQRYIIAIGLIQKVIEIYEDRSECSLTR